MHALMKVSVDYTWLGKIENEVRSSHYPLHNIDYLDVVDVFIYVKKEEVETFSKWIMELTNGQAKIDIHTEQFLEFPRQ